MIATYDAATGKLTLVVDTFESRPSSSGAVMLVASESGPYGTVHVRGIPCRVQINVMHKLDARPVPAAVPAPVAVPPRIRKAAR